MLFLKKKLTPYFIKSALKKNQAQRRNIAFEEAYTFGIVYTYTGPDKYRLIVDLAQRLKIAGKKTMIIAILDNVEEALALDHYYLNIKDVGWQGEIKSDHIINFVQKPFDYLLHVDVETNDLADLVLAKCQAKCRVGKYLGERDNFYEMMIKTGDENDDKLLVDELLHYTQQLI